MRDRRKTHSDRADGKFWIVLSGLALLLILALAGVLALLIVGNSLRALWPHRLALVQTKAGDKFLGLLNNRETAPDGLGRSQYKVGNRDLHGGQDFRWVADTEVAAVTYPAEAALVQRRENGVFLGFLAISRDTGRGVGPGSLPAEDAFQERLTKYGEDWRREAEPLQGELSKLANAWQDAHYAFLKADYQAEQAAHPDARQEWAKRRQDSRQLEERLKSESAKRLTAFGRIKNRFAAEQEKFVTAEGKDVSLPLSEIVSAIWPNRMHFTAKLRQFALNFWDLLTQNPREANSEGGLYPALFGTILLVFIMAISAFPLGVAAGVYLREYARDGFLSRSARVAVNNLAGVPSIVYGIFGLGFFIYGCGSLLDEALFPERVAAGINTFGGGGILWSSLTLGLLTLPVVIVATEEALATVPSEVRQGSLALGATKFQTLCRVVIPMASPGILTGFILAMARAAGEVAPLMLTGVVKSAPGLALDGQWPYLHLERKFMHLGFHIYDMAFQSPNVEASMPLVYLTALVLLGLVFLLNLTAIALRKRMRDRYALRGF